MTYPRQFGPSDPPAREHLRSGDWPDESWALGGLLGIFLLAVIALYAVGGAERPVVAMAPADETSGQSIRPIVSGGAQ
jgi:hypothetical protein